MTRRKHLTCRIARDRQAVADDSARGLTSTAQRMTLLALSACVFLLGGCKRNSPPERPTLSGPAYVWPSDTADVTASSIDRDDDVVSYLFSWGDSSSVEWSPSYASGQSVIRTHVYPDTGEYHVRVKARDSRAAESDWSDTLSISVGPVPPNVPATPWGAHQWFRRYPFPCSTAASDPDSAPVAYQFDWGDGVLSSWSEYRPSGSVYSDTHSFAEAGPYSIRARATNGHRASGWSAEFQLTVTSDTPPAPPYVPEVPRGPSQWSRGTTLACTTVTTDPNGALVSYQFNWGDGDTSQWSQFMDGGVSFADAHSYQNLGSFAVRVRAKNSSRASDWSAPLNITVDPREGDVLWSIGFTDPHDPNDSAYFSLNSFAIGPDNTAYVACDYGAIIARRPSGSIAWKYVLPDLDQFTAAPVVADDGTIIIGCSNRFIYALNSDGTVKWADSVGSQVWATGALGADGTSYFQTADTSVVALRPDGTQLWSFPTGGGNSAPVIGSDGTVYATNQDGTVYAFDPSSGGRKWTSILGVPVIQAPAIDPGRNVLYIVTDAGLLQTIDLANGGALWSYLAGAKASGPVVSADGTIYVGGDGKLTALSPDGTAKWVFLPPMAGVLSTAAITVDGYIYVLVVAGKKRLALQGADSLYAVNPDGTRRWACGLGEGLADPEYSLSAPKVDANGYIYVGDGFRAWCVVGVSAPAQSAWPMFQHDAQNSGRAR